MKRLLLALSLLSSHAFGQSQNNDWENPTLIEQNKEKPHATFMLFDKKQDVQQMIIPVQLIISL
jgi:beta-galactosidase